MSSASRAPAPLPPDILRRFAAGPGLLLCLDYDGTLADITADPDNAWPREGASRELRRLLSRNEKISLAIITGRTLASVKRLLGIDCGLFFSGVHGLEFDRNGGREEFFVPEALASRPELEAVRQWFASNIPEGQGFRIEDKGYAIGLHYRLANTQDARDACARLERFLTRETPQLKVVRLKMLAEVMPRVATKGRALLAVKAQVPSHYVTAYFGDDTTDEDAFAALPPPDIGILVGAERETRARFRVDDPAAVVNQLRLL